MIISFIIFILISSFLAREFIHCIADEIREKVACLIAGSHFMSILTDGSQARKTKSEKELVLVRTTKAGIPVYFVVSLLEMASFGGGNAESLKKAIDSVFSEDGIHPTPCKLDDYRTKLVSSTADGANVNMGKYNGALTLMKKDRPWLILIHCMNHRIELAIKDTIKLMHQYEECDQLYKTIFYLFKNSGKLKDETKKACEALNITFYPLKKLNGTRFVTHRRRGFTSLLQIWPGIITAFNNALSSNGSKPETKAKIRGVLAKLEDYRILCRVAGYLDVLEAISPLSLIFEKKTLMAYEVKPAVEKAKENFIEMSKENTSDAISSFLHKFSINKDGKVTSLYPEAGHERKLLKNRKYIEVELELKFIDPSAIESALATRSKSIDLLVVLLEERFSSFIENEVINAMTWIDPKLWEEDRSKNGFASINKLIEAFSEPLNAAGFDRSKVFVEWKSLQSTVKAYYSHFTNPVDIWAKFFQFRHDEYPNILMLAEIIFCISASNSAVERVFSILTTVLSDRRLTMRHETMEDCVIIAANSRLWTEKEKDEILNGAVERYMKKRRLTKLAEEPRQHETVELQSDSDESSSDDESGDESDYESDFSSDN